MSKSKETSPLDDSSAIALNCVKDRTADLEVDAELEKSLNEVENAYLTSRSRLSRKADDF